jgi:hypothetical protein
MDFYFDKLLTKLKSTNNREEILSYFINPFSGYHLCDHFVGVEIHKDYPYVPIVLNKNQYDLLKHKDLSCINDNDIIYVEVNYFDYFIENILNKINKKIVLITGQWYGPQIIRDHKSNYVLNNSKILLWVSQNPIYVNSIKYLPIPYGVFPCSTEKYAKVLLNTFNSPKSKNITHLPCNPNTNECRKKLPYLKDIEIEDFYNEMSKTKFLLSPIGDRDDCYRHTECIGMGTIPISNVGHEYKQLFKSNMHYTDIDGMVAALSNNSIKSSSKVDKNFICFDYHKDLIQERINLLTNK